MLVSTAFTMHKCTQTPCTNMWYVPLELDIKKFMVFYRASSPRATILPKCISWRTTLWDGSSNTTWEQDSWAESIHTHLNRLERTYSGIPNALQRLKYI